MAALAACGGSSAELPRLDDDAIILAFGDSLTYGTGAKRAESYPAVLERLIGRRVVNAGVPGEVSAAGLSRLPELLDRQRVDLVILCHGGNDILRKKNSADTARNLREMIRLVRERGIPVVLLGVPDPGIFLDSADFYADVASDLNVPIEDDVIAELLGDNRFKSDMIHPNAQGYRRLAESVRALLSEHGAL
ncbi:MAG: arylesterase [Gammaproteobacteria bacterium]|nr:arylesterase [Gammaproteobacteria bacterium]NIR83698.1 arylesterase [Gammaproteobacteria bacterium]NIR88131.1 arylesterase [Gammaproteobacteria bacterium]NIU04860.1 arylesterase [Gammaproteobacteria bacterium]NIV51846.1 arylesterase [Gammaproteobacteria bacterium]